MVFNCKGFYDDDIEEEAVIRVIEKERVADHHERYQKKTTRKKLAKESQKEGSLKPADNYSKRDDYGTSDEPPSSCCSCSFIFTIGSAMKGKHFDSKASSKPAAVAALPDCSESLGRNRHEEKEGEVVPVRPIDVEVTVITLHENIKVGVGLDKRVSEDTRAEELITLGDVGEGDHEKGELMNLQTLKVPTMEKTSHSSMANLIDMDQSLSHEVGEDQRVSNDKKAKESVTLDNTREDDHEKGERTTLQTVIKVYEMEKIPHPPRANLILKDQSLSHEVGEGPDRRVSADKKAKESITLKNTGEDHDHKKEEPTTLQTKKVHVKEEKISHSPKGNLIKKDQSLSHEKTSSSTTTLRIRIHCDRCRLKIDRTIGHFKGVNSVNIHADEDIVTVIGDVDVKELVPHLQKKLKRRVELVPTRKNDGNTTVEAGNNRKDNSDKTDDHKPGKKRGREVIRNEKNINEGVRDGGNRQWNQIPLDSYNWNGMNWIPSPIYLNLDDGMVPTDDEQNYDAIHSAWGSYHLTPSPITEMFSDENPNACTIM